MPKGLAVSGSLARTARVAARTDSGRNRLKPQPIRFLPHQTMELFGDQIAKPKQPIGPCPVGRYSLRGFGVSKEEK